MCEPALRNDSCLVFGIPLGGKEGWVDRHEGYHEGILEIVDGQSVLYFQPKRAKAWARSASWVADLRFAELADSGRMPGSLILAPAQ